MNNTNTAGTITRRQTLAIFDLTSRFTGFGSEVEHAVKIRRTLPSSAEIRVNILVNSGKVSTDSGLQIWYENSYEIGPRGGVRRTD